MRETAPSPHPPEAWAPARRLLTSPSHGASVASARTAVANTFVSVETFYLFNCRSLSRSVLAVGLLSNPLLLAGVATMVAFQVLFTYAPPMNALFASAPIAGDAWLRIVGIGALSSIVVGAEKWIRRAWRSRRRAAAGAC